MFGKEKKAEDKKKETALKREENRKKSGVKHKKPKQKQAGNGNLSCLFGLGSAAVLAGCIAYAFVRRGEGVSYTHLDVYKRQDNGRAGSNTE